MWVGESKVAVDDKGRVSVPRRLLGQQSFDTAGRLAFYLTLGLEGCIFVFSEAKFAELVGRMDLQPFGSEEKRTLQRLFFAKALRVELDEKNRLALPDKLRALVGIDRDVTILGLVDRAEIWATNTWETLEAERANQYARLDSVLLSGAAKAPQA